MDEQIVAIYTLTSDFLQATGHRENSQCRISDAEVMTTALVAALYFGGNFELARRLLKQRQYIPKMLSKSRLNRRWHRIGHKCMALFLTLADHWKALNVSSIYSIDSFPIAVCDNYRIQRNKIYGQDEFRGFIASKKRYFYGLKIHIMVTATGEPVEFFFSPGSFPDVSATKVYDFDLPAHSIVYADKAYNLYWLEDLMAEVDIHLMPIRKKNSKRPYAPWVHYWQHVHRKMVETTASLVERLLPKSVHAVTARGFELKVALFVLAISVNKFTS